MFHSLIYILFSYFVQKFIFGNIKIDLDANILTCVPKFFGEKAVLIFHVAARKFYLLFPSI